MAQNHQIDAEFIKNLYYGRMDQKAVGNWLFQFLIKILDRNSIIIMMGKKWNFSLFPDKVYQWYHKLQDWHMDELLVKV